MRLIDADYVLPLIPNEEICSKSIIANAPTIEERPTGEWIKITKTRTVPVEYICSVCGRKIFDNYGHLIPQSVFYPYCHCGARMEDGEDETGN